MVSVHTPLGGRPTGNSSCSQRAPRSGSRELMAGSQLGSPLYRVRQSRRLFLLMASAFDLPPPTILPILLPFGKFGLTDRICIECCPAGIFHRMSAVDCGHRMATISCFAALFTATASGRSSHYLIGQVSFTEPLPLLNS